MNWEELDWSALERFRELFLRGGPAAGPYWTSPSDLASYDFTYGERIGWKWDQVLRELRLRRWRPVSRAVLDWGCGSGIAARRVISFFGAENFDSLTVWDHSPLACDFAADEAQRAFPALRVAQAMPSFLHSAESIGLLVVSHVLNELPPDDLAAFVRLVERADAVLWVEPGTHATSRALGAIREELRGKFHVIAPCTHENACPILQAGNERHWCHHFAPPPGEIFADSNWVQFGQRAGIDLRSLPYAFVAFDKVAPVSDRRFELTPDQAAGQGPALLSRIIGRPEHFKPFARVLNCDAAGLTELEVTKRADPALFKQLDRTKAPLVYRWRREGNKILGGELISAPESGSSGS